MWVPRLQFSGIGLEWVTRMSGNIYRALLIVVMVAVIVTVDLLFFRHLFWYRLISNIGIAAVFLSVYFVFLRKL